MAHIRDAINDKYNSVFHKALLKYDEFDWSIIETCDSRAQLNEMEFHYIKQYNTKAPNGYNLTYGGDGMDGFKVTQETKDKISKSMSGKNAYWHGRHHSNATKKKLSEAASKRERGAPSKETRNKIAKSLRKNYLIESPEGKVSIIDNLKKFCSENNLNYKNMNACANKKRKTHKNYTCVEVTFGS
jgi:group I intron endonuclease